MERDYLIVLLLQFNLMFYAVNCIPMEMVNQHFGNVYIRSALMFEYGNLYSAQMVYIFNNFLLIYGSKTLPMMLHLFFISNAFIGPDILESKIINSVYDFSECKLCYSIYFLCVSIVLGVDFLAQNQEEELNLGEWKPIRKDYLEDPMNFIKVLGIYYSFGIYMAVTINRYKPSAITK
jgi:hypothetical protein